MEAKRIGERIKALRTDKMMTQRDLAGSAITRNMLSQIENGLANPSLATIQYLAQRLNVPAGYLLADERDEIIYVKSAKMAEIKQAYASGNVKICRDICLHTDYEHDDELLLMLAECTLALAIEKFNRGALHASCALLDEAVGYGQKSLYTAQHVTAIAATYFRYMRRISVTLSSDRIDEMSESFYPAMTHEFSRYAIAIERLEGKDREGAERIFPDREGETPISLHFCARLCYADGDRERAYELLHRILTNFDAVPEPVMYFVFSDLEELSKELDDFKSAYTYSMSKIALGDRLVSE